MTALIENYNHQLNEIYLMYADEVVKNRTLSIDNLIKQNHEALAITEDIKSLLKERDNLIMKFKIRKNKLEKKDPVSFPKKEIPLKSIGKLTGLAKLVMQTISSDYTTGAHIEYAGGFNL